MGLGSLALDALQTIDATAQPKEPQAAPSRAGDPGNSGALAFKRTGDPNMGNFGDATVLRTFGQVPENLDEL